MYAKPLAICLTVRPIGIYLISSKGFLSYLLISIRNTEYRSTNSTQSSFIIPFALGFYKWEFHRLYRYTCSCSVSLSVSIEIKIVGMLLNSPLCFLAKFSAPRRPDSSAPVIKQQTSVSSYRIPLRNALSEISIGEQKIYISTEIPLDKFKYKPISFDMKRLAI